MLKSILLLTAILTFNPLMALEKEEEKQTNQGLEWDKLPPEIRYKILKKFPPKDHANIAGLNMETRDMAEDNALWKRQVRLDFPGYTGELDHEETWKNLYNRFREDQSRAKQVLEAEQNKGGTNIVVAAMNLTILPEDIGEVIPQGCKILNLDNNQLTYLPFSTAKLTGLQQLKLDTNQFKDIPDVVSKFTELKVLSLNDNDIKYLPDWLPSLKKLEKINLVFNPLDATSLIAFMKSAPVDIIITLAPKQYKKVMDHPEYNEVKEKYLSISGKIIYLSRTK